MPAYARSSPAMPPFSIRSILARSFAPDLIVLDVMLPDKDGFELFGALRQQGRMPIIMLTARGERAGKLRGLKLGADDYITKPTTRSPACGRSSNPSHTTRDSSTASVVKGTA